MTNSKHTNLYKYRLDLILKRISKRKKFIELKRKDFMGARVWSINRDVFLSDCYEQADKLALKLIKKII